MDCSPPGSSVHGIFQAWILDWVAISFSRGSSWPKDRNWVSHIVGRRFIIQATREDNGLIYHVIRFGEQFPLNWASLVAQRLKSLPPMWETRVRSLGLPVCPSIHNLDFKSFFLWNLQVDSKFYTKIQRANYNKDTLHEKQGDSFHPS